MDRMNRSKGGSFRSERGNRWRPIRAPTPKVSEPSQDDPITRDMGSEAFVSVGSPQTSVGFRLKKLKRTGVHASITNLCRC
ncbi:hypothetical protein K0M31_013535 [Melipona bicolor]|uniref:Uncharacterized protein n=1 Tax=Melipona bicolor TaxID=60889 RepID=A0AA40FHT7_9HYME|nr:hypothetical protein K0M31_013535 [Melipona bicolor]